MANGSFWSLLSCSGFSAKCIGFFYLLKTFLPLNSDKYFELFWCFVLGFPLSFYWLSGVKWIRMWSHRPCNGWDFWPCQLQFYPGVECSSHNFLDLSCQHAQLSVASAVCGDCKLLYEGPWQTRDWALLQFCTCTWHYNSFTRLKGTHLARL